MYCQFYGFSEKPFEVTPDPKFLFLSPSHREMLASLVYGIGERRGFISLVGEVGTGKTTLINAALDRLEGNTKVAYLCNTAFNFNQMLLMMLHEFRLVDPGQRVTKVEAIRLLNDFTIRHLSEGGNVVLIIDEAQNLDADSMENLRLLSNLETRKHKLIQIVLAGQPELDSKLGRRELRQLAQRISVRRTINPLTSEEIYAYIQHRLIIGGFRGSHLFEAKARRMICDYSGGIPRKINILCDNALLIGYALKKRTIDVDCVAEAAEDLKWAPINKTSGRASSTVENRPPQPEHKKSGPRIAMAGSIALAAGLVIAAWITFERSGSIFSVTIPSLLKPSLQGGANPVRAGDGPPVPGFATILPTDADSPEQVGMENVANPKRVTASNPKGKKSSKQAGPAASTSESDKKKVTAQAGTPSEAEVILTTRTSVTEEEESVSAKTVVVARDDTLSGIIYRAYGRYEDSMLSRVLKENPEILTPDSISVGQVIRLPEAK